MRPFGAIAISSLALGAPSPIDGGAHSYLEFAASGLHASRDF